MYVILLCVAKKGGVFINMETLILPFVFSMLFPVLLIKAIVDGINNKNNVLVSLAAGICFALVVNANAIYSLFFFFSKIP